jgi:hypothetical protein
MQQPWGPWEWPLAVPQRETFHQADMLMQGLRTLSPRPVQKLLTNCGSVKAKRLFLWFANATITGGSSTSIAAYRFGNEETDAAARRLRGAVQRSVATSPLS